MRTLGILLLVALSTADMGAAEHLSGKPRIIDGDTIEVSGTRIRLEGIDAPERGQECSDRLQQPYDCGAAAVRTLVDLTKGQTVNCEATGEDRYGRALAICRLPSGLDLNAELVRLGRVVAFRRYSDRYIVEEDEARRAGAGLSAGTFEHPGCWRAQLRGDECQDELPSN
ncbi:MAG: thermonuclease family protein [Deltaproteobacteria bacterium]